MPDTQLAERSQAAPHDAPIAIRVTDLVKTYRLFGSVTEQALDILGLGRLQFWKRDKLRFHEALKGVSFELRKGERLAVIGRNGAGKSTLLKLFNENFRPTSGRIEVFGRAQALLYTGIGFYPEFTGYENLRSSLLYNGLTGAALGEAIEEIVEFVELGDFLHQPFKTYSLGMRARLQFAAATAIRPDILLIDEVLGAGDAYFTAKSALRIKALANSGCTLILVSHGMDQVLQFCERAIWLEAGTVAMDGRALPVVRAYEEFSRRLEHESEEARSAQKGGSILSDEKIRTQILDGVLRRSGNTGRGTLGDGNTETASRWPGVRGLKILTVRIFDHDGRPTWTLQSGAPMDLEITVEAEIDGEFECSYVVVLFSSDGRLISRLCSEKYKFHAQVGQENRAVLRFPSIFLGNGKYVFTISIYKSLGLENTHNVIAYDTLSRAFEFDVITNDLTDPSLIIPSVEWRSDVTSDGSLP